MVSQTPLQADLTVMNCRARGRSAPDERRERRLAGTTISLATRLFLPPRPTRFLASTHARQCVDKFRICFWGPAELRAGLFYIRQLFLHNAGSLS